MPKISVVLVIIMIICFILGAWPISLIILGVLIIAKIQHPEEAEQNRAIEELEKENEALRKELADQVIRHAMDKAESREKKD